MKNKITVLNSSPSEQFAGNARVDFHLIVYTFVAVLLSYFSISTVGMSDFSSLDEDHFWADDGTKGLQVIDLPSFFSPSDDEVNSVVAERQRPQKRYHFEGITAFDQSVNLYRINELSQDEFKKMIIKSVPRQLRYRLIRHLDIALDVAQKYKVDPFWVLAVIWTESHFNEEAESLAQAKGLMQIMPKTVEEVSRKLRLETTTAEGMPIEKDPRSNIEMGVYYMRYLQRQFWQNPFVATIAYNMGPNWVRWSLENKKQIGNRNQYLNKVSIAYQRLSSGFHRYTLEHQRPFTDTLVAVVPPPHKIHTAFDIEISPISSL